MISNTPKHQRIAVKVNVHRGMKALSAMIDRLVAN
jgi:hypothetical protein